MTATNHAVFGALLGALIKDPVVALPAALVSHFVLDSLPHFGDSKTLKNFMTVFIPDAFLLGIFFLILLIYQPVHFGLLIVCALVAISPDLMWLPNALRRLKAEPVKKYNKIMRFHKKIQWGERQWGIFVEIVWLIFFSSLLIAVEH